MRKLPLATGALCILVFAALVWAILSPSTPAPDLAQMLEAAMPRSGVKHDVTAVLVNFRGYDTFLEVAVLTVTALIGLALKSHNPDAAATRQVDNRLLDALAFWLAPVMLMVAVYLLWSGSKQPGGAFQAGAVLAATGVLLRLSGVSLPFLQPGLGARLGVILGLAVFFIIGLGGPLMGKPLFTYPADSAGGLILAIETALSLSIGLILLSLFSAAAPPRSKRSRP